MKPFLAQIATLFYTTYGERISRMAFVFPNRRAGLFFQKYLSEVADKPLFSPPILTMSDLFVQLSGKQVADPIDRLFTLYRLYVAQSGSPETFDEFMYWGEMLLADFDDVDKCLVDARMLFTNVTDLREIDTLFDYLSDEQVAAIRTFWSSFYPRHESKSQEEFLAVWQILYELYTAFRQTLAAEGTGYEGMLFREVAEGLKRGEYEEIPYEKIVFVGLNALSASEECLLGELQKRDLADFYWDYASPMVNDPDNRASYFVARNLQLFPSKHELSSVETAAGGEWPAEKRQPAGKRSAAKESARRRKEARADGKLFPEGDLFAGEEWLEKPEEPAREEEAKPAEIEVIGIPSGIGQAKQVYSLLEADCGEGGMNAEKALRTAIVLPDEHLLLPVLNAIPPSVERINVTMGYPLGGTPVASLMEYIVALQKNVRYVDRRPVFYFRDVLPVLNHRYISGTATEVVASLVKEITENNRIYIDSSQLSRTPLLEILFTPVEGADDFSAYLVRVLEELNRLLREREEAVAGGEGSDTDSPAAQPEEEDTACGWASALRSDLGEASVRGAEADSGYDSAFSSHPGALDAGKAPASLSAGDELDRRLATARDLESEFIFHYFTTVNRLREVIGQAGVEMKIDTYFRLLRRLTDTITIPFRGEPLSGLQIMGVLETRALDFDRLIILSMNEGVFPVKKTATSFIPYNLRRGFGLPTYEHQDSIWAYHFYRLIYRARRVSLLYDTRSNGLHTGEVSRFVHQLRYHYELPVKSKLVVYNVSSQRTAPLEVRKTPQVIDALQAFLGGGDRAISASAVNTYLDCPLKFYFSVVEGVREEEEVNETIESDVFGSILHKVMEVLYKPFCGKLVTADLLKAIRRDTPRLQGEVARAFGSEFFKSEVARPLTGQHFLIGEMIRKYVEKVLDRDAALTPFRYLESEKRIYALFPLSDGRKVRLKGFIDRLDEVGGPEGAIRIVDYKSGSGVCQFDTVSGLFDLEAKERPKAVMQVFLYAWMYSSSETTAAKKLRPAIYYMRTLFGEGFDSGVYQRSGRAKPLLVDDFEVYRAEFEAKLRECLDGIFAVDRPFCQTPTGKACTYCNFKAICGK